MRISPHGISALRKCVHSSIQFTSLKPEREKRIRSDNEIQVLRREFRSGSVTGIDRFFAEIATCLGAFNSIETADFEIFECKGTDSSPLSVSAGIRYEIVGTMSGESRESRIGSLSTTWVRDESGAWRVSQLNSPGETFTLAPRPLVVDITELIFQGNESYKNQHLHGAD